MNPSSKAGRSAKELILGLKPAEVSGTTLERTEQLETRRLP